MPETSRKAVNLSMISGHWYFLICHPQKEGVKQQSTELHKMFEGKQALQSSWGPTFGLPFMNMQHPGLREMCSRGTRRNDLRSYCLPDEPCSQTMWASLMHSSAKPARLSLSTGWRGLSWAHWSAFGLFTQSASVSEFRRWNPLIMKRDNLMWKTEAT